MKMGNALPDLGIELSKQYPKGTFFYFKNFLVELITFTNQEYVSVTAKVFLNIPALATFDYSLSEFEKFLKGLPETPAKSSLKKQYKEVFSKSSGKVLLADIPNSIHADGNGYIFGYLWEKEIDGNYLPFAPFKSYELLIKNFPTIHQKDERPLNIIAFDFLLYAKIDDVHIPEMMPHLNAMLSLTDINQSFGLDKGKHIVLYFLESIKTWKSKHVKPLKSELKAMLKKIKS
jgi:hypothetical protein